MITILSTIASILVFRLRSRASLELELIALRHQVITVFLMFPSWQNLPMILAFAHPPSQPP